MYEMLCSLGVRVPSFDGKEGLFMQKKKKTKIKGKKNGGGIK